MLLEHKVAVIYGAGGAVGSAVATEFAAQGATVFMSSRTRKGVDEVANVIRSHGDVAHAAEVDAAYSRVHPRGRAVAVPSLKTRWTRRTPW